MSEWPVSCKKKEHYDTKDVQIEVRKVLSIYSSWLLEKAYAYLSISLRGACICFSAIRAALTSGLHMTSSRKWISEVEFRKVNSSGVSENKLYMTRQHLTETDAS